MDLKEYAKDYNELYSFNLIPMQIRLNDSKTEKIPSLDWAVWQSQKQSLSNIESFNWNGTTNGLSAICGIDNLRNFDFDVCRDKNLISGFTSSLDLPESYEWITETGRGYHLWFYSSCDTYNKAKYDFTLSDESYECDHVELRWKNCITVLPPSIYPNGNKYNFINIKDGVIPSYAPFEVDGTKLNETIKHFFTTKTKKNSYSNHKDELTSYWLGPVKEGKRHNALIRLAGKYKNMAMPEKLSVAQLLTWNKTNVFPSLPETEIVNQVRDIYKRYNIRADVKLVSAKDIQTMELKPINWIIEDLIPEGLGILAGRPKIGKSWLALNLSLAIAQGGTALGQFKTNKSKVLYIPYEDNYRRLKDRIKKILSVEYQKEAPANLVYPNECDFPKLNESGLETLEKILDDDDSIKFVVIDTLGRAIVRSNKRNANPFQDEYDFGASLQKIAIQRCISILLVHHTTKAKYDDIFDQVLGTTGLTASPDLLMMLYKDTNKYMLSITGRDIEAKDYVMDFNDCLWNVDSETSQARISPERERIIELFKESNEPMKTGKIASLLDTSEQSTSNILGKMVSDGLLKNVKYGVYTLIE